MCFTFSLLYFSYILHYLLEYRVTEIAFDSAYLTVHQSCHQSSSRLKNASILQVYRYRSRRVTRSGDSSRSYSFLGGQNYHIIHPGTSTWREIQIFDHRFTRRGLRGSQFATRSIGSARARARPCTRPGERQLRSVRRGGNNPEDNG